MSDIKQAVANQQLSTDFDALERQRAIPLTQNYQLILLGVSVLIVISDFIYSQNLTLFAIDASLLVLAAVIFYAVYFSSIRNVRRFQTALTLNILLCCLAVNQSSIMGITFFIVVTSFNVLALFSLIILHLSQVYVRSLLALTGITIIAAQLSSQLSLLQLFTSALSLSCVITITLFCFSYINEHHWRLFRFERQLYDINKLAVKAQEDEVKSNQMKSRFLANMSHEIRTPLTAIMGYAERIQRESLNYQELQSLAHVIVDNGEYLLKLINEILDLSKVESGKFEIDYQEHSLFKLIDETSSLLEKLADNNNVSFQYEFELPFPEVIQCDGLRLQQIVFNLCSNAIKFADAGSVNLVIAANQNMQIITFKVTDNGIGMDEVTQRNLFRPFFQGDSSTTRRYGGTGLGLNISYQLAHRMEGDIKVSSQVGVGSTFTLILPLKLPFDTPWLESLPNRNEKVEVDAAAKRKQFSGHVLLAEDHKDNKKLITEILKYFSIKVTSVNNGKEAFEAAVGSEFDLILMDIQMPVMDGIESLKLLRATGDETPAYALTANVMKSDKAMYEEAGFQGAIGKPIIHEQLINVLQTHLVAKEDSLPSKNAKLVQALPNYEALKANYMETLADDIKAIQSLKLDQKLHALNKYAHRIKGSAGNYDLSKVSSYAAELEASSKDIRHRFEFLIEAITSNSQLEREANDRSTQ
ncbi:MAG: response regulator [Gammaproteobacteria bacterium]|nr:response regulator [Gammaproteobacteria bacterium]